jgi:hypothetical protein
MVRPMHCSRLFTAFGLLALCLAPVGAQQAEAPAPSTKS